jgi:hypothetical protein
MVGEGVDVSWRWSRSRSGVVVEERAVAVLPTRLILSGLPAASDSFHPKTRRRNGQNLSFWVKFLSLCDLHMWASLVLGE